MPQRLTPLEVAILERDTVRTPAHVGTVSVLEPVEDGTALDHAALLALVAERVAYVPRFRQRVLSVPGRLAAPVWVDDVRFDLNHHVRRAVLPGPGTWAQLEEFVARVLARRLDRARALWELYLVEGLEDGRRIVVGKTHLALVDNLDTVDLAQVLIDSMAQPVPTASADGWLPLPEPTSLDLVGGALWESAQDPETATGNLRGALTSALGLGLALGEVLAAGPTGGSQLVEDLLGARSARPASPLAGPPSGQRRFASTRLSLADLTAVATARNVTTHDVVLAAVAGALRTWLLSRGELVGTDQVVHALAPVAVREGEGVLTSLGSEVASRLVPLPIGTEDPAERLRVVAATTAADPGLEAVGARELSEIPGFAPATLHALGARRSVEPGQPGFDLLLTNVPGPQAPLFLGPAPLAATYPAVPLPAGQVLSIALTSYQGEVFCGVVADRVAADDLTALTQGLATAVAELQ